jgi:succinoglycan biosynthesis protein ExoL
VRRRVNEVLRAGYAVTIFGFSRKRSDKGAFRFADSGTLRTIELGDTANKDYRQRIQAMLRAATIVWKNRACLRNADVIVSRNVDLGLLACLADFFAKKDRLFVYEILDVQPLMISRKLAGRIGRIAERLIIRRSDLVTASSPGFIRNYLEKFFRPLPQVALVENKVSFREGVAPPVRRPGPPLDSARPVWTIGYFGKFRCRQSLIILTELARSMPDRVRVYMRGYPHQMTEEEIHHAIKDLPNFEYGGSYRTPDDLPEMMSRIHLNWCIDVRSIDDNSAWLLPNRIYEGGYFAVPAVALEATETGRYVQDRDLGYVLPVLDFATVRDFIDGLDPRDFAARRARSEARPAESFMDEGAFPCLLEDAMLARKRPAQ